MNFQPISCKKLFLIFAALFSFEIFNVSCTTSPLETRAPAQSHKDKIDPRTNTVQGGGVDGSGGDGLTSSPEEVEEQYQKLKEEAFDAIYRMGFWAAFSNEVEFDKKFGSGTYRVLKSILTKTDDVNSALYNLKNGKIIYKPKRDASCSATEGHRDSAAKGKNGEGEICISLLNMRRYTNNALIIQMVALTLHEILHLYEYPESTAKQLQTVLSNNADLFIIEDSKGKAIRNAQQEFVFNLSHLSALYLQQSPQTRVCHQIDKLYGILERTVDLLKSAKGRFVTQHGFPIYLAMEKLRMSKGYCGISVDPKTMIQNLTPVTDGDRKGLNEVILHLTQDFIWDGLLLPTIYLSPDILKDSREPRIGYKETPFLYRVQFDELSLINSNAKLSASFTKNEEGTLVCKSLEWADTSKPISDLHNYTLLIANPVFQSAGNKLFKLGNEKQFMVRKYKGEAAFEIAVMMDNIQSAIVSGTGGLSFDGKHVIPTMYVSAYEETNKAQIVYATDEQAKDRKASILECELSPHSNAEEINQKFLRTPMMPPSAPTNDTDYNSMFTFK